MEQLLPALREADVAILLADEEAPRENFLGVLNKVFSNINLEEEGSMPDAVEVAAEALMKELAGKYDTRCLVLMQRAVKIAGPLVSFMCKEKAPMWRENFQLAEKCREAQELHERYKASEVSPAARAEADETTKELKSILSVSEELTAMQKRAARAEVPEIEGIKEVAGWLMDYGHREGGPERALPQEEACRR